MELEKSMDRMGVDHIDLYQFHALDKHDELEVALGPDGALQTMLEAKDDGLISNIGITSHRPLTIIEALKRFEFDTILFPMNFVLKKHLSAENDYESLIRLAKERGIGTIVMKAFAKGPWPPSIVELPREKRPYNTWYEPFDEQEEIDRCLNFALSQEVTTLASACDVHLVPKILDAAERFQELSSEEQEILIGSASNLNPLFPRI